MCDDDEEAFLHMPDSTHLIPYNDAEGILAHRVPLCRHPTRPPLYKTKQKFVPKEKGSLRGRLNPFDTLFFYLFPPKSVFYFFFFFFFFF